MSKEVGRFYFKRSINGNLLGEFSNSSTKAIETECAVARKTTTGFLGTYETYWSETNGAPPVILDITIKPRTNNSIYTITWKENDIVVFWGEGMLCDDILIGDYRNFKDI